MTKHTARHYIFRCLMHNLISLPKGKEGTNNVLSELLDMRIRYPSLKVFRFCTKFLMRLIAGSSSFCDYPNKTMKCIQKLETDKTLPLKSMHQTHISNGFMKCIKKLFLVYDAYLVTSEEIDWQVDKILLVLLKLITEFWKKVSGVKKKTRIRYSP